MFMRIRVPVLFFVVGVLITPVQAVEDLPGYNATKADARFIRYLADTPDLEQTLRHDEKLSRCVMTNPQLQRRLLLRREKPVYAMHCQAITTSRPPAAQQPATSGNVRREARSVVKRPPRITARNLEDQAWAKKYVRMSYDEAGTMAEAARYKVMYMASTRDENGELLLTREGKKEAARILAEARKPETQKRAKQHLAQARAKRPSEKIYGRAKAEIRRMVSVLKKLKMPWD